MDDSLVFHGIMNWSLGFSRGTSSLAQLAILVTEEERRRDFPKFWME